MDIQSNYSLSEYEYSNKLQFTRIWMFNQTTVYHNMNIQTNYSLLEYGYSIKLQFIRI